ncbi:MAG: acyl-CoA dehydrogenase [Gammaproteobacteria bacterium]|nr:acyl-CoA dehydrogenase [Gammaproteobacteria bacterium]
MASIISVFVMLGLVCIAAFYKLSVIRWTTLIGISLLLVTIFLTPAWPLLIIYWLLFLVAALFANLHELRQRHIVTPALKHLKAQMPAISDTEREAIEAGNTWWEKELFSGDPQWPQLYSIPKPTLSDEEKKFLDTQVEHLCSIVNDWEIVNDLHDLPANVWDYLKKEKFFGMAIPKEYGGLGFSALAHSTIVVKIASRSVSTAVNTMVPNSLGPAELLIHYGTEAQKQYYLPKLATGEEIPCFALTAPEAGSDAGSIPDSGVVCKGIYNNEEVLGIRLSWDKRYITLAPVATVLGLAIRLNDPNHLLGDKDDIGITLCLIPTSHEGVEIGSRHFPLQLAFMNGPTRGKDVFIPLDWIIGGEEMAGQGWRMLMECLSIGRSISLPALSTACGKITYRYTGAYAKVRHQFNTAIANFEGIEESLSDIAGYTYLLEAARIMTAGAVDLKVKPSIASAIAKYHMTELSRHVVSHAMDVHAGHMIQAGPRNFLANVYFAVPISITVEGANILTRNLIIFGQGAIRCHPYLLREVELISAEAPDIAALDKVLMSHIGFFTDNFIRNLAYGLTAGKFINASQVKSSAVKKYQRQLTRMSAALALLADISLILLGGSLKRRERISARLGDILSQLYLGSTVLKYFHDQNEPQSDVPYVCWVLQDCLQKIQVAIDELLNNYPNRILGKLLRALVFPYGQAYYKPTDQQGKNLLPAMLHPSELRERLTAFCYKSNNPNELTARLDQALELITQVEPLWKKLNQVVKTGLVSRRSSFAQKIAAAETAGIITADESRILSDYDHLKDEIIKVNEFSFDLNTVLA